MGNILVLMLVHPQTKDTFIREVKLPVEQALQHPLRPQFICEIPKGYEAHILGVEQENNGV